MGGLLIGHNRVAANYVVSRVGVDEVASLVTKRYRSLVIGAVCRLETLQNFLVG